MATTFFWFGRQRKIVEPTSLCQGWCDLFLALCKRTVVTPARSQFSLHEKNNLLVPSFTRSMSCKFVYLLLWHRTENPGNMKTIYSFFSFNPVCFMGILIESVFLADMENWLARKLLVHILWFGNCSLISWHAYLIEFMIAIHGFDTCDFF